MIENGPKQDGAAFTQTLHCGISPITIFPKETRPAVYIYPSFAFET